MTDDVPSALSASRLARACGFPSMIHAVERYSSNYSSLQCQTLLNRSIGAKGFSATVSSHFPASQLNSRSANRRD
jgi:hypothetical protein